MEEPFHDFLKRIHPTIHLAEVNDDSVGFFNSVPRQQILDSLSRLVALYQERETFHRASRFPFASFQIVKVHGPASHGPVVLST